MPISLNDIFERLLQPIAGYFSEDVIKTELSLEELRELHRIQQEQKLALERHRLGTSLARPFNGLL